MSCHYIVFGLDRYKNSLTVYKGIFVIHTVLKFSRFYNTYILHNNI